MAKTHNWNITEYTLPPENVPVITLDSGYYERVLILRGGHWWLSDNSMYVYFTPKAWRPIDA